MGLTDRFFPEDASFGYEALRAAGAANFGGADIGEVLALCRRIPPGDEDAWLREWKAIGDKAVAHAEKSASCGNAISAHEGYLRASNYYRSADFYRRQDPFNDEVSHDLCKRSESAFRSAMELIGQYLEDVEIPYEGGKTLPGYFMRPDAGPEPRKTVIFNGGFDSTKEEGWFAIAAAAVKRGYNVLAFEGPGQGQSIRRDRLFFRSDWEHVLTPVMDYVLKRSDVIPAKVAIMGWSLGGYLVARAATEEHRAAAIILNEGLYDAGPQMTAISNMPDTTSGKWAIANGLWTFGVKSVDELQTKAATYTLEGRVDKIKTPTLVLDARDDEFFKGEPEEVYKRLTCKKSYVPFPTEEGSSDHCHVGAYSRVNQVIFDFLAETL